MKFKELKYWIPISISIILIDTYILKIEWNKFFASAIAPVVDILGLATHLLELIAKAFIYILLPMAILYGIIQLVEFIYFRLNKPSKK